MEFMEAVLRRRSGRNYTEEVITEEQMNTILQAGMLAPTGRNLLPVEFIAVQDKDMLAKLSVSKAGGAGMLAGAAGAVVVIGDTEKSDTWIEDCSNAMMNMHLCATDLGLASCWVQIRNRFANVDGKQVPGDEVVKGLLGIPANYQVLSILSIGLPGQEAQAHTLADADLSKVHREMF